MSGLATSTIAGGRRPLVELAPYVAIPPAGTAGTLGGLHAIRVARAAAARVSARQSLVAGGRPSLGGIRGLALIGGLSWEQPRRWCRGRRPSRGLEAARFSASASLANTLSVPVAWAPAAALLLQRPERRRATAWSRQWKCWAYPPRQRWPTWHLCQRRPPWQPLLRGPRRACQAACLRQQCQTCPHAYSNTGLCLRRCADAPPVVGPAVLRLGALPAGALQGRRPPSLRRWSRRLWWWGWWLPSAPLEACCCLK